VNDKIESEQNYVSSLYILFIALIYIYFFSKCV